MVAVNCLLCEKKTGGTENIKLNLRFNLFHQILIRNRILATKRNAVIPIRTLLKEFNFLNAEWNSDNIGYVKSKDFSFWVPFVLNGSSLSDVFSSNMRKKSQRNRTDLNDVIRADTCNTSLLLSHKDHIMTTVTSNFGMRNTFPEIKYRLQYLGMRLFLV